MSKSPQPEQSLLQTISAYPNRGGNREFLDGIKGLGGCCLATKRHKDTKGQRHKEKLDADFRTRIGHEKAQKKEKRLATN